MGDLASCLWGDAQVIGYIIWFKYTGDMGFTMGTGLDGVYWLGFWYGELQIGKSYGEIGSGDFGEPGIRDFCKR